MGVFYYDYKILFSIRKYLNIDLYVYLDNNIYDILFDEIIDVDLDGF
jgi:hypothetical protein